MDTPSRSRAVFSAQIAARLKILQLSTLQPMPTSQMLMKVTELLTTA